MLFNILRVTLIVLEVIVCSLLITAILIQKSKTQGAGLAFGAGVGETLFGGQIGNVMTKVTVVLAIIFLVNTTALTYMAVKAKYRRPVKAKPAKSQMPPAGESGGMVPTDMPPIGPSGQTGGGGADLPLPPQE